MEEMPALAILDEHSYNLMVERTGLTEESHVTLDALPVLWPFAG
jgi:hypothetical protein